jgi:hypothetical protein
MGLAAEGYESPAAAFQGVVSAVAAQFDSADPRARAIQPEGPILVQVFGSRPPAAKGKTQEGYRPPLGGTKHWIVPANMKSNASPVGEDSGTILSGGICTHFSSSQAYQVSSGCRLPLFSTLNLVFTTSASPQQYRDLGSTFLSGCRLLSGRCRFWNHALLGPSGHCPRGNAALDNAMKLVVKATALSGMREFMEALWLGSTATNTNTEGGWSVPAVDDATHPRVSGGGAIHGGSA